MAESQPQKWPARDGDSSDDEPPPVVRDPNLVSPLEMHRMGIRARQEKRTAANQSTPGSETTSTNFTPTGQAIDFTFDERKGQPAPLGVKFAPFPAVARYCYKFVHPDWLQKLASAFFDQNQIYDRNWEFHYVPPSDYNNALVFITLPQLQALIDEINTTFPAANITLHEDVIIDFEDLPPQLRPRWAGRCSSRYQYNSLLNQISVEADMVAPRGSDRSVEAFKAIMDDAAEASKAKSKRAKAAKKSQFVAQRQGMVKETLRAQRYLGLLPKNEDLLLPDISNLSVQSLDTTKPAPHPFDGEPIFIAIDAEAYERPPRMVTEVGVCTLDTRDLQGHAPGEVGKDWQKYIRARHFRVDEYKNYVNSEYCQGCPGNFEFGDSEFVSKNELASVLASCFREPFSKVTSQGADTPTDTEPEKRNIVLVGHDLAQDITFCREVGFGVLNRGNILDTVDTQSLYKALTKDNNARSLGSVVYDFDMSGWHLHNAGNDAVYTLHIMLAICVKAATDRGNEEATKKMEEDLEKRTQAQLDIAKERVKDDLEGWDSPSGEDGGVPLPPTEKKFLPKSKGGSKPTFGPEPPNSGLYTMGGAILDV